MVAAVQHTINYFQAPINYFWQWAEKGAIIEWKNGSTICYTEDLALLMKSVTNSGVPSFGSILLVLAACNDSWSASSDCIGILQGLKKSLPKELFDPEEEVLDHYIHRAVKCMDLIASLPSDLRKGTKRAHVLHELFKDVKYEIAEDDIRSAVDEMVSGRLDKYVLSKGYKVSRQQYKQDLGNLVNIFDKYQSKEQLERQLRAGVFEMPAPAPIEFPEAKPGDLLQELSAEPRTVGIANLAKRIIAALNIPIHSNGSSDQPFGGVSDITNRGNYDRLLLSELAYDDNIILARLANNEALYLRREEPPENPKNRRVILVDTTIKMWGMPRVFAMSAAIACTLNVKHGEEIETLMLGGSETLKADTTTIKGVMEALELMDPSLNCCNALEQYFAECKSDGRTDKILISRHELLKDVEFQKLLAQYPDRISFIISIGRRGEMHFSEVFNGRMKLLSTAKFDLEEILFSAKPTKKKREADNLPLFFEQSQPPLLFPTTVFDYENNCIIHEPFGVVAVTDTHRVLQWRTKDKGAIELLPFVEPGLYSLGSDAVNKIYLLVTQPDLAKVILYAFSLKGGSTERFELQIEYNGDLRPVFQHNYFYIKTDPIETSKVAILSCRSARFEGSKEFRLCKHIFKEANPDVNPHVPIIKRHVNNGYNILHRLKTVATSLFGNISLGNKVITRPAADSNHISIRAFEHIFKNEAKKDEEQTVLKTNENCKLTSFYWNDGSRAIVDSRGFLHLVSSDITLPEVTVVLVHGKTTACWASTGEVAGNDYFLPAETGKRLSQQEFYEKYITPIVKRIDEA